MAQLTLPLILVLGVAFVQAFPEDPTRIVGGTSAKLGQYPYQVSLRYYGLHKCGGTLVSSKHVITAAHCVADLSAPWDGLTVMVGTVIVNGAGRRHYVSNVVVHPNYSSVNTEAYPNDIAVLTLSYPVIQDDNVKVIPVATKDPPVGAELRLTGWGRTTTTGSGPLPEVLQTTTLNLLSNQECQQKVGNLPIGKGHLCALKQRGIGACFGDSGGPLVYNGQLVGVVSWVFPCAQGRPDVFTRVSQYADFINKIIGKS